MTNRQPELVSCETAASILFFKSHRFVMNGKYMKVVTRNLLRLRYFFSVLGVGVCLVRIFKRLCNGYGILAVEIELVCRAWVVVLLFVHDSIIMMACFQICLLHSDTHTIQHKKRVLLDTTTSIASKRTLIKDGIPE